MKSLFRAAIARREKRNQREARAIAEAFELVDGEALPEAVMDRVVAGLLRDIQADHQAAELSMMRPRG